MSHEGHSMQAQVLVSLRDDGGYVVLDALEREHVADDAAELGLLLARLVRDPELPEPVVGSSTQVLIEEGLAKVARRVTGPELDELAVAAGRVGATVGTRIATELADVAKTLWAERRQKKAQKKAEKKTERAAPRPSAAKRNGASAKAVRRPSSLRFPEDER